MACAVDGMEVSDQMISDLPAISLKVFDLLATEYADGDGGGKEDEED
jgi:hypothetical protein